MSKLHLPLIAALGAVPAIAHAAPPACSDPLRAWEDGIKNLKPAQQSTLPPLVLDGSHLDCLKDDVLVINGDAMARKVTDPADLPPQPIVNCANPAHCVVDYSRAVTRALEIIGQVPLKQWDELVLFGQQMTPEIDPPGPLFFRQGYLNDRVAQKVVSPGVNEVDFIGLASSAAPTSKRQPGHPYVGYIAAGGTDQVARFIDGTGTGLQALKREDPSGPVSLYNYCHEDSRPPQGPASTDYEHIQSNPALCYDRFYTFFDALAQATGSIFAPYLKGPQDLAVDTNDKLLAPLVVPPLSKAKLGTSGLSIGYKWQPTADYITLQASIWNSFLDLGGSLFAGNTFTDNGDGTFQTTLPSSYYGINVPFAAGWKPGTVLAGNRRLRFQPLDLYSMGLLPPEELPQSIHSFITQPNKQVVKPALAEMGFTGEVGPQMGLRIGVAISPELMNHVLNPSTVNIPMNDILQANGGLRAPAFKDAPHAIRQLWIVVSKPQAAIEAGATNEQDKLVKVTNALQHLDAVVNWRHQFAAYFYMLTQYRGRVINTWDGVDDNAYFEFGQPVDDAAAFQADDGVVAVNPGTEKVAANLLDLKNVLRFNAVPGGEGGVTYTGKPFALRISGNQAANRVPNNAVTLRMRVPVGAPGDAFATVTFFDGPNPGPSIRLPGSCYGRANCKETAFLVPDGKWHTYSARLNSSPDFANGSFSGLKLIPSSKAYDSGGNDAEGIEVDYLRVANEPSVADSDKIRVTCSDCATLGDPDGKKRCTAACQGKKSNERVVFELGDGFLDPEDNCPGVYNPTQEDGNGDGVGNACEDFDEDGIANAFDNCPTVTNSRQRDQDGDGFGDVCDSKAGTGCFLNPSSLAGSHPTAPGALGAVAFLGLAGLLIYRRRRR
jgi:hypothetical protein